MQCFYGVVLKIILLTIIKKWRKLFLVVLNFKKRYLLKNIFFIFSNFLYSFFSKKRFFLNFLLFFFYLYFHHEKKFFLIFLLSCLFVPSNCFKKLNNFLRYFFLKKLLLLKLPIFLNFNCYYLRLKFNLTLFHAIIILQRQIFFVCRKSYGHSTNWFIRQINYLLLKWFSKWKHIFLVTKKNRFLSKILFFEKWMFNKQFIYINRNNSNKSLLWKITNYFGPFSPYHKNFWIFGDRFSSLYVLKIFVIFD
uniref:Reverse transcriptase/intron maturase n=1 Tax=Lotharella vacuolata TaxID=74820 RepID=A0A140JZS2_9EUKA|nr:reverse transcriptase/intron maturase [Lotharella vacuolata]BAU62599.1 reverse transcriptase/intron maturase [Lotharella vacuolata]